MTQQQQPQPPTEQEAMAWSDQARSIVIVCQTTYDHATAQLVAIKGLLAEVEATFGPMQRKSYDAWKEVLAQRARLEKPLTEAEGILKVSISRFVQEQEQRRLASEREMRQIEERRQAEFIDAQMLEAELNGATTAEVQAIASQPIFAPVFAQPTYKASSSVSSREGWKTICDDKAALIRAAANDPRLQALLEVNQVALNQLGKALKSQFKVPGCKCFSTQSVAARRF